MKYVYHFLITKDLKNRLNEISELGLYSFSNKIIFVVSKIIERRDKLCEIGEGTSEVQRIIISRRLGL